MSFTLFTDSCSNLPGNLLKARQIHVLPCTFTIDEQQVVYHGDLENYDIKAHYDLLRAGKHIKTSLLNAQLFLDHFRPVLEAGQDIVYVGLSGGISGTINAARIASEELAEEFPQRRVRVVDSMGAGLGTGILTIRGADARDAGKTADEAAYALERERWNLCEYFTVDDLMFLRRTGRLSTTGAVLGTMLGIKPILRGDETGHIVASQKCRGRKKAVSTLVEIYAARVVHPENQIVAISHGDCEEEALVLAEKIREAAEPRELLVLPHEPMTGSHVGPGMLGLFFFGEGR